MSFEYVALHGLSWANVFPLPMFVQELIDIE